MNRTKIQYALIAYEELTHAQEKASFWSHHLQERLGNLSDDEVGEYNRRTSSLIEHLAKNRLYPPTEAP